MNDYKYRVTFYVFSKVLNKEFRNVELHRSVSDYQLRAMALNWTVETVEPLFIDTGSSAWPSVTKEQVS